jgi:predicted secreted protein
MATHTGSEGTIKVGSDTVGEIRSYSISETADTIEDTSMGDSFRTYKTGLKSFSGSVDVFWDETDAGQTALSVGSSVTFNVYPEGATTGDKYFTGTALVTGLTVNGSSDGMVEASLTLQGTGALSLSTAS